MFALRGPMFQCSPFGPYWIHIYIYIYVDIYIYICTYILHLYSILYTNVSMFALRGPRSIPTRIHSFGTLQTPKAIIRSAPLKHPKRWRRR
jgi:hypothetical protein